ncbi:glycosyltransferase involved in cell wall biosynthesis [Nitrosospira sp. Nsp5]|uniref:Glycosyltransferase involved in cell wall bisynthesis n=1 Tax=Nitrosospira multiformis TaxID=1231 RepID=A0ABY0T5J1_9PROT|nr:MULTISPECIES: glycosyltransferase [Nitrosospira]PTR09612.1 glycosyltransferase involved in cell wall biosynthesis [Nitrosospira sp. Nsp5]SDQ26176.1 Glycosyltransferase involved in cell wall bisynthesis [Nitrosospira multiformis]
MPKVSVILTSFNHEKHIQEAINTVLNQSFTDFELIIWDDASADNSWYLINQYSDPRIRAFRNEVQKKGGWGINKAISEVASGKYIAIHHSDDAWEPDKLQKQVAVLDDHPEIGAVFTWSQIINEYGVKLENSWFIQENKTQWQWLNQLFLEENHLNHPSVLIRKQCYQDVGVYSYGLAQTGDAEMWSRVLIKFPIHVIQERLTKHRFFSDESNSSGPRIEVAIRANSEWNILRENYLSIANFEDIVATFPGLERFRNPEGFDNKFLLAMACLECKQRNAWQLGLKWLFDLLNDETRYRKIKELYSFTHLDFIRMTAEFDVYCIERDKQMAERDKQMAEHDKQIAERDKQITSLNQILSERNMQIAGLYNSNSWRITWPLRTTAHHLKRVRHAATPVVRRAASYLVKQYLSSPRIRGWYASAKNISSKAIYPISPKLHELLFVKLKLYLRRHYLNRDRSSSIFASERLYRTMKSVPVDFRPKVSVIVPSYNHARFLRQRLDSIYQQTYSNFEVILLDDASTDESQIILEEYRRRYPQITQCSFNEKNSGEVFNQWQHGFEIASGDLIWIAESDDYCSENLVADLVKYFVDDAVMLAYCQTTFVERESTEPIWSLEEYLVELDPDLWRASFVMSAHHLVNKVWAIKNIIPNVSSAIFRHPRKLELLKNKKWKRMRICGDWVFYLHLIRGGLVAYTPNATNYYRLHQNNTSRNTYSKDIYYQEHEQVAKQVLTLYRVENGVFERQRHILELHWRSFRTDYSEDSLKKCYDYERIRHYSAQRKPNLLMASFALIAGGGETFPIKLANILKAAGYGITFLNCHEAATEIGVRRMLREDIPLLELDTLEKLSAVVDDMGIELVHSHHGWVDVSVCNFLEQNSNSQLIVTLHGMYETIPPIELPHILPLLKKRVDKFVYTADKNLTVFDTNHFDINRFVRIDNALDIIPITPVPRFQLGISENAFLICLVSRAIPEKGWQEAIEAVKLAREIHQKDIHLLLIGEGPEYDRLKPIIKDEFIHFLGFRANIRDYFATSDLGFLPSRFLGESFPLVLIDCLHSNRPMLASNVGEIKRMMSTSSGPAGTVFDLENWNIPITNVAEIIATYAEEKNLYLDHLHRVPVAAAKFDPAILLKNYEAVYLELCRKKTGKTLS